MSSYDQELEIRIGKALQFKGDHPDCSWRKLGVKFDVPYTRLYARAQGRGSHSYRKSPFNKNMKLSDAEEAALCDYINRLHRYNLTIRPDFIRNAANRTLKQAADPNAPPPAPVGQGWVTRFISRLGSQQLRQKAFCADRMAEEDTKAIKSWFQSLKDVIELHGIQPHDIWSMDEIMFRTAAKTQIAVTRKNRCANAAAPTSHTLATLVEVISAMGDTLPMFLILPGEWHMAEWFEVEQLDAESTLGVSTTGYLNDDISLGWLEHFDKHSRAKTRGEKRLLLFEGNASYLTVDFIQYCDDHDIIPFGFLPNALRFLQPLDSVEFQPMEHFQGKIRDGIGEITEIDFLGAIKDIRRQDLKEETLKDAFKKTGIHPFNPEAVLAEIRRQNVPRTPPRSLLPELPSPFGTPTPPRQLKDAAERLTKVVKDIGDPELTQAFERFRHAVSVQITELFFYQATATSNQPFIIAPDEPPHDAAPGKPVTYITRGPSRLTKAAEPRRARKVILRARRAGK